MRGNRGFWHSHGCTKDRSDAPAAGASLAVWLAVWLGRVLQEQVDFLKAENRVLGKRGMGKHRGLDNAPIVPSDALVGTGKVVRRDRLGGLLGFYYREAA